MHAAAEQHAAERQFAPAVAPTMRMQAVLVPRLPVVAATMLEERIPAHPMRQRLVRQLRMPAHRTQRRRMTAAAADMLAAVAAADAGNL
jgi:hypothetical protein